MWGVVRGVMLVAGCLIAAAVSAWLVDDLASPTDACAGGIPLFESPVVEDAEGRAVPPLIRCRVDYPDAPESIKPSTYGVWEWDAVIAVALLDAAVSFSVVRRIWSRRRRQPVALSGERPPR